MTQEVLEARIERQRGCVEFCKRRLAEAQKAGDRAAEVKAKSALTYAHADMGALAKKMAAMQMGEEVFA